MEDFPWTATHAVKLNAWVELRYLLMVLIHEHQRYNYTKLANIYGSHLDESFDSYGSESDGEFETAFDDVELSRCD